MQRSTTTEQLRLLISRANRFWQHRWSTRTVAILAFLFILALPGIARELPQDVSLSVRNVSLDKVFKELRRQTGYSFVYTESELQRASKVTIEVSNTSLDNVLNLCFRNQPLTYTILEKIVIVKPKAEKAVAIPVVNDLPSSGKKITMRGRVMNDKGDPLAGATITVRRSDMSTTSDESGYFLLSEIEDDAVLVVSSVGHVTQQVKIKGLNMEIRLPIAVKEEEEVVVAYNKISTRSNTGAVTVVKGEQIQTLPNRSFDKSLQGLVPGLLVTSGNGQPGSPASNFMLRGIATGGQPMDGETFRNPLIIVDGVPVLQEPPGFPGNTNRVTNPLAQLNPSDIETISILKDAAAVALYGSQASNGVILVTTKKGKSGKTTFNFRHQTDISSALEGKIKMLNQQEYLELLFESYKNSNPAFTDAEILADLRSKFPYTVRVPGDTSFYPQANWSNALLNNSAITLSNEISMSGGNEKSNFYVNFEYTKQNGVAKNTDFDRKSMRFNYEHRPTSWFKVGLNTTLSYTNQNYSNSGFNSFLKILAVSPLNPIYDIDGNYIYQFDAGLGYQGIKSPNPLAQSELDINNSTSYRGLSNLSVELRLLPNLSFSSLIGIDFMLNEAKEKNHPLVSSVKGFIREQLYRTSGVISTNLLQYNNLWNNTHSLNILAGQEVRTQLNKYTFVFRSDISSNPDQDQLNGGNSIDAASGNSSKQNLLSYFGQINYGFKNKYYLSGSIRSDGSSRFGNNNRFGTYWSAGGGWVISAESFMKSISNWVSFLKLRGSLGPAGNSAAISDQLRFDRLSLTNFLNGIVVFPDVTYNPGNPSIQWEETFTWDAGLELRLFKSRISLTADIYTRKTKNLIAYNIQAPLGTGYSKLTGNIGDIKNQGIELSISANFIQKKHFNWIIYANWSRNRNRLTKAFIPETNVAETNLINKVGYEYNSFYLREWAGVNPDNGRPMWKDSTGKPNENFNAAKPIIAGKPQPDGFGSIRNTFTYKQFAFSIGVYYQYGSKVFISSQLQNDGNGSGDPYLNQSKSALNRWQKPGDIASNPRRLLNGQAITPNGTITDNGSIPSTRYLFDGDFIRLANIGLSYDFSKAIITRLRMNSARLFIQAHNLATWTRYSGQDPENVTPSGVGGILYPQAKSYTIGINLGF